MRTGLLKSSLKTASVNAAIALALSVCATPPLETSGSLASYDGLAPASGMLTRSKPKVDKANVLAATSVTIVPTSFSGAAFKINPCVPGEACLACWSFSFSRAPSWVMIELAELEHGYSRT
jgi:hypothetical protein